MERGELAIDERGVAERRAEERDDESSDVHSAARTWASPIVGKLLGAYLRESAVRQRDTHAVLFCWRRMDEVWGRGVLYLVKPLRL